MKIYNEIIIDMNPESSSYGETLHEDSFEYNGDIILMQGPQEGEGASLCNNSSCSQYYWYTFTDGAWVKDSGSAYNYAKPDSMTYTTDQELQDYTGLGTTTETTETTDTTEVPPTYTGVPGMEGQMEGQGEGMDAIRNMLSQGGYDPKYDLDGDGAISVLDIVTGSNTGVWSVEQGDFETGSQFDFTTDTEGEFDPTSAEFQQYVGHTGGFEELLSGFGVEEDKQKFFDPANLEKLDIYQEKYDVQKDVLDESKRAAKTSYEQTMGTEGTVGSIGLAEKQAGLQAGRKLFDIKSQADIQAARSGFARHGGITSVTESAAGGVWQDLIGQQQALEGERGKARSAWTGAQSAHTSGLAAADIDLRTSVSDFWEKEEEKFYGTLGQIESWTASDRRLKDNITIVDKSSSGLNVYTFNYKNPDRYGYGLYQGVMSDEIPSSAVMLGKDGYDLVDYSKIDVEFKRLKEI